MQKNKLNFLVISLLSLIIPSAGISKDVFIRARNGNGQGLVRQYNDACYVVTASHVVKKSPASEIIDSQGKKYRAEIRRELKPDLAILEIVGSNDTPCDYNEWPDVEDLDYILNDETTGFIKSRNESGSRTQLPVTIRYYDKSIISVKPQFETDQIIKTMSGSALVVGRKVIGILVSKNVKGGKVYRLDYAERLLETFFKENEYDVTCFPDCESLLSELDVVEEYVSKTFFVGPNDEEVEKVFHLPESWPAPPYLHVVVVIVKSSVPQFKNPLLNENSLNDTEYAVSTQKYLFSASLSSSKKRKVADIVFDTTLFQYTGVAFAIYNWGGELINIELSGSLFDDQLVIRTRNRPF